MLALDIDNMDNLDKILDECIDRLNLGESIEACLADYPGHRGNLEPLLAAMLKTRDGYGYTPGHYKRGCFNPWLPTLNDYQQNTHYSTYSDTHCDCCTKVAEEGSQHHRGPDGQFFRKF